MRWKNFKIDVWKFSPDKNRPVLSFFLRGARYLYFFVEAFSKKECYLKGSLLTFYSLIAIVPLFAIVFSIAEGLGFDQFLQQQILETFHEQQYILSNALGFAHALLSNIRSGTIFGAGALVLFFSVFSLFENIEKSLNSIWNVTKHRSVTRRAINYITALIVFPLVFIFSISLTLFVNGEILKTFQASALLKQISDYYIMLMKFAPYVLMCALFSFVYIFTPNAKIYLRSRIIAGVLAGIVFQLWQLLYIFFQVSLSNYNAVYGSFAALPLFVVWMQVNFVIFLSGATIAAQLENWRFLNHEYRYREITQKYLVLLILRDITRHFLSGEKPVVIEEIAARLGVPLLDTREMLSILEKSGMITEIWSGRRREKYQLVINPELFTLTEIMERVEKQLVTSSVSQESSALQVIAERMQEFEKTLNKSGANCTLKDLARA